MGECKASQLFIRRVSPNRIAPYRDLSRGLAAAIVRAPSTRGHTTKTQCRIVCRRPSSWRVPTREGDCPTPLPRALLNQVLRDLELPFDARPIQLGEKRM